MKKISIIIPCRRIDSMTEKCVRECLKLDYEDFEILVLLDEEKHLKRFSDKRVKIIKAEEIRPSFKRNLGMQKAKGDFFAFIDSDAYPKKDWLKNAIKYFDDEKIGIVGGPNLTPKEGNFWEKVSGHVLANFFVSGKADIRYKIAKNQFTHELPTCNYISRKEASSEYDPNFLTAEDSKFCFDCKKKGYKILYAGDVVVYHHRRDSLKKHIKQIWIYARDIAWLTKEDFSSWKLYYAILSMFVIGILLLDILSLYYEILGIFFIANFLFYLGIMFITSIHKNLKTTVAVFITSILTHFAYGFGWIYGILTKKKLKISER
ncbi:MAG: glycosyltransferase [archaeon]